MTQHLQREIERLKKQILALSSIVEECVFKAVKAVSTRDAALAQNVIDTDTEIDNVEVEVEEECLKILALHQPVAIDLRFIIAVLKINNDLERIGDLASNIASRARSLAKLPPILSPFDFENMSAKVKSMLRKSLLALVNLDPKLAREVLASDDEVDDINRHTHQTMDERIRKNPEESGGLIYLLSVSRNLERIADHATNIAEDVIYMIEGSIVRHGKNRLI